uniref:Uncharacterized protein n=1 Tax=Clastoptera arizonana TaxID=38151 RepID=A0A1B6DTS2_9HEMI
MSFFIRKKTKNTNSLKRKTKHITYEPRKKTSKNKSSNNLQSSHKVGSDSEVDSDFILSDEDNVLSNYESDEENEITVQEKKVSLAKKYLEEIEKEEKERNWTRTQMWKMGTIKGS